MEEQIGLLLCGKKAVKFEKDGVYYYEVSDNFYKIEKHIDLWKITKFTAIDSGCLILWSVIVPFNLEAMKKLFKLLNT